MKRDEAAQVLDLLTAAYPSQELADGTVALWLKALTQVDAADAKATASRIVASSEFFPSMAKFREQLAAERRARENREAVTRGLARPRTNVPDPECFAQIVGGVRDQLAQRATRRHWHAGPDPCPVCHPLRRCPSCGTTHEPAAVGQGTSRQAQIIDLQQRLAQRRGRLTAEAQP